jgi:hypothetical protein
MQNKLDITSWISPNLNFNLVGIKYPCVVTFNWEEVDGTMERKLKWKANM